jgi:2',3'-cyclic-nucleotide 2'-phosphodiesterase (5'-nucleotidase family)
MRLDRFLALSLFLCAPASAEVRTLTILHINDLHARISPLDNHNGGFAYVAAAIRREREHCTDCILLNAGDLVQGSPVSTIFHGLPVFEIGNFLGFDVSTLGNHEFDYGWPQARKFLQTANYPIVSSNIVNAKGEAFAPKPYVILKVNGLRVAVLGAMTDSLGPLTTPKLLEDWHTLPVLATARKYAAELKSQSDLIVLLAHITGEEEQAFLADAPEIPIIVSGHIHRGIDKPAEKDGRMVVRVKGYGEELGRLELKVDTEKKAPVAYSWKILPIDSTKIQPVPEVAAVVKHWEAEVTARVDRPLAVSRRAFTKAEVKKLIEQALRDQTGSDFAHMNLGGVRDVIPAGQLLERNIWDIMPFDNTVVVGSFKGRDLPPVVVGDRKIDPDRTYTLAVSDYTAANQDTRENLQTKGLKFPNDVGLVRDILIDWFRKKKTIE